MSDQTHFEKVVSYVMSNDESELTKMTAERDYALHCLERGDRNRASCSDPHPRRWRRRCGLSRMSASIKTSDAAMLAITAIASRRASAGSHSARSGPDCALGPCTAPRR